MDVDAIADDLRRLLREEPSPPVCAWLFGSVARGDDHAGSDVDVAVLFRERLPATLDGCGFAIAGRLEAALQRPVDLIVINGKPADLVHRVLRDGRLLLDDEPSARVRFEVTARREYFDVLPYLREYRGLPPHPRP